MKKLHFIAQEDIDLKEVNYDSGYSGLTNTYPGMIIRKGKTFSISGETVERNLMLFYCGKSTMIDTITFTKMMFDCKILSHQKMTIELNEIKHIHSPQFYIAGWGHVRVMCLSCGRTIK